MSADLEFEEAPIPAGDEAKQLPASAPYMSYKGLQNYITKFREEGLPGRFDGSYFGNISGSTIAQTRGALRALDLIDDDKHPTDLLKEIVAANPDDEKTLLKMIFEDKYADALALSANATAGQLADVFRERGLSGATVSKAISFFLSMAEDVGVSVSPHFKKGRGVASNGGSRKRVPKKATEPTPTPPPTVVVKKDDNSPEALRAKYVNLLMKKVEDTSDDLPADLLDRIERALGYEDKVSARAKPEAGTTDLP